jgi:multiple sugar transport system substrate-binding protein
MGNGATLLDSSNAPTFNPSAGDPFYDQIQWVVNGIHKDNIINPDYTAITEADIVKKMTGGEVAMTLLAKYNLAAMNAPGSSSAAGNFSLALMPGKSHVAYGFAKMYSMTKLAQDRGHDATQAAISLIEFFGANDSTVLKRWAVENGLGFGFNSPFSDPDIQASLVKYYGSDAATLIPQQFKIAQTIPHPVWFGQWVDFANKQALLPALRQDIQVADAVDKMSKQAVSLNTH